jgi:RNA polymerase sigma-70 factor (ECF subfamily)
VDAETFAAAVVEVDLQLRRVAFLLTGDRELAEECAQEALVRAWERMERGGSFESLPAWTTTVALNWCRTQLRRRGAEARALRRVTVRQEWVDSPGPSLSPEIQRAVLDLPLRQREVVVLHYLLDHDVATVARIAGVSQGAVKNALFHARVALAKRLAVPVEPAGPAALSPTEESS